MMKQPTPGVYENTPAPQPHLVGVTYSQAECDELCEIAERDGYEKAVQEIDQQTGGDGEYRYCLGMDDSDRHTPDANSMIQRIVDRFEVLNLLDDATKTGGDQPDDLPTPQDCLDGSCACVICGQTHCDVCPLPATCNTVTVNREVLRDIAQLLSGSMFTYISTEEQARARGSELYALLATPASGVPDAFELAASLIEDHVIQDTSSGKVLVPRQEGNRDGLHYAAAIRALSSASEVSE